MPMHLVTKMYKRDREERKTVVYDNSPLSIQNQLKIADFCVYLCNL